MHVNGSTTIGLSNGVENTLKMPVIHNLEQHILIWLPPFHDLGRVRVTSTNPSIL